MGNLTVRNLDDQVIEQLKVQARKNERSLEGEIRYVLTQEVHRSRSASAFFERARRLSALSADLPQTDSVELLRQDRDR